MFKQFKELLNTAKHTPKLGGLEIFKYIGPGLLVTVGFIDPGNWASNLAAGAEFGYSLLWMVTLSTIMLIVLQHNVAHLGIASGLCLSEAASEYLKPRYAKGILYSAMLASISTSLAEILGGAIALQMLFNIPIRAGSILVLIFVVIMLFTNTYRVIEKWIIAFVSIIGLSFIYELSLVEIDWNTALPAWVTPAFPEGSMVVIMSVLGAVVMPHNLFLHSEVIQSRQWNIQDDKIIKKQLRYEYADTILSMVIGWAINSAMILLAAAAFFGTGTPVTELEQANSLLAPLLGNNASVIFAVALLFAGISSTIKDSHSRIGVLTSLIIAFALIMVVSNPFQGLIYSQMALSVQLPITIFTQVYLTSSSKVMGKYKNSTYTKWLLYVIGGIVTLLNVMLLISFL